MNGSSPPKSAVLELMESRRTVVGGLPVRRALPRRAHRMVGPWCFIDHFGPLSASEGSMRVGPHPHLGLQTVTWLLEGEVLHRDSLGSEQLIRPGQLNLMTAGRGIAHAEESSRMSGALHGVQLWIAQPTSTRNGPPAFEHREDLPIVEQPGGDIVVFMGGIEGIRSPARTDSALLGAQIAFRGGIVELPVSDEYETALFVLCGQVRVDGASVGAGTLAYLGRGRDTVAFEAALGTCALVLGGEPFAESILMWWNYVARDRAEITTAHAEWTARSSRFGVVQSGLDRIIVPPPPWAVGEH